jgi:hypothetical protein
MKTEEKFIPIDAYEEGAVIAGLNKIRTEQLEQGKDTDFVNDLMLKIIQTRPKKVREKGPPRSRAGTSWGEEEQRSGADTHRKAGGAERSLRRRDEAR